MGSIRPGGGVGGILAAGLLAAAIGAGSAAAAEDDERTEQAQVLQSATVNGRSLEAVTTNEPLVLDPEQGATLELVLRNSGDAAVTIHSVRLDGQAMGMTMYNYTTWVDIELPPGTVATRRIDLDLYDLGGQAVGLIPSRLQLLDDDRETIEERPFSADVRGSPASVYGVFGLAVAGITLVLVGGLLLAIWRNRLPANRWQRAMRFLPAGVGVGFVLTFTLSATRQLTPSAGSWATLVLVCAGAALALGYFVPLGVPPDEAVEEDGVHELWGDEPTSDDATPGPADQGDPDETARLDDESVVLTTEARPFEEFDADPEHP